MTPRVSKVEAKSAAKYSFAILLAITTAALGLMGWLGMRLLIANFSDEQGVQNSASVLVQKCLLLFGSPYLTDRLLAYTLLAALLFALSIGARKLLTQLKHTKQVVAQLQLRQRLLPAEVREAVLSTGLAGRVVLIEYEQPLAFCTGLFRGGIFISTGLVEAVGSGSALQAILWHESYHLERHDPLRMAVAGALVKVCFFLPLAKDLYQHYLVVRELAADQGAISVLGTRQPLASALYRLATAVTEPRRPISPLYAASALDTDAPETLSARFAALLGEGASYGLHVPLRHLLASAAVIAATAMLLVISYTAPDGLLPALCQWLESTI